MNTFASFGAFVAQEGKTDELAAALTQAAQFMETYPGCKEYRVHIDAEQADKIWVYELWVNEQAHAGCLKDPAVRAAIAKGISLIKDMPHRYKLVPVTP